MVVSRQQSAGQNHHLLIDNKSFENMGNFKYLGTTVVNRNCIHKEIKRRLNMGNACCNTVQSLLPNNIKIKIYKTIILSFVLYGCET